MSRAIKIELLSRMRSGELTKEEGKLLLSLEGVYRPDLSNPDKAGEIFKKQPELLSLFEIDLSSLTDEQLRQLIDEQERRKAISSPVKA